MPASREEDLVGVRTDDGEGEGRGRVLELDVGRRGMNTRRIGSREYFVGDLAQGVSVKMRDTA
jgi:hypothetical protein